MAQPHGGRRQIALHRGRRDPERGGNLIDLESGKEPQLHDLGLPGVEATQIRQRIVQAEHVDIVLAGGIG